MEIRKNLAFTREEYLGRVDRVRERMKERGLDALLLHTPENICYLTGFHTSGYYFVQVLIVPADKDPVFVVRALEKLNVDAWSWLADDQVIAYMDYDNPADIVFAAISDLGLANGRLGFEMDGYSFLPIARYEELKTRLADAKLVNGSGMVEKERAIKSPAELDYIRQACRITELGMGAVRDNLRAGMTENELAGHVHQAVVAAGGEYPGLPLFLSSGWRTSIPHANPTEKVIETGDHVFTELTGVVRRYAGPLFRTFSVGEPTRLVARNAAITEDILEAVIAAVRPGVTSHDVNAVVGPVTQQMGDPGIGDQAGGLFRRAQLPARLGRGRVPRHQEGRSHRARAGDGLPRAAEAGATGRAGLRNQRDPADYRGRSRDSDSIRAAQARRRVTFIEMRLSGPCGQASAHRRVGPYLR